jgi:hypothetical protein
MSRIEYTVSTYAIMVPMTISIQAASLVFDQSIMAIYEARAPNTKRLVI